MNEPTNAPARSLALLLALGFAACVATGGCEKREEVRSYSAPKDAPERPASVAGASGKPVSWTVPAGWKELPAQQMRYASFAVSPDDPQTVLTVIPLPSSPLVDNVNRWEGQLGLPPSSADKVADMADHMHVGDAHVDVVDIAGPPATDGKKQQRLLGAVIPRGTQTWFVKLMGPADVVAAQKTNFDAFVRSFKFNDGGAPNPHDQEASPPAAAGVPPAGPPAPTAAGPAVPNPHGAADPHAAAGGDLTKWKAPTGWTLDEQPRPMRLMTYRVGAGDKSAEIIVSKLGKDIGGLLDNVNRWRGQVGLSPVADVNEKEVGRVTIAGKEALLFDFAAPAGPQPQKRQVVVMAPRGNEVWFFKILGDAAVVGEQAEPFRQFLASIEFGG